MAKALGEAAEAIEELRETGAYFHSRGWSLGTSSNYSVVTRRTPPRLVVTASGKDKSRLGKDDFVVVDENGDTIEARGGKPSAETMLHVALARTLPEVGAVLHTHSVWGTLLSERHFSQHGFWIHDYEMLKGLAGVGTHEHREWVEIFPNTQDIAALAKELEKRLKDESGRPLAHGFLMHRHGLYTWGRDLAEARRHVEIFEFLFEVTGRRLAAGW